MLFHLPKKHYSRTESVFDKMASPVYESQSVVVGGFLALVSRIQARRTPSLLMFVAIKVLIYQISRILYNIFLHPLARFPGPLLRSGFYIFNYWEELRGVQAKKALALHDRYGPVVRIGPDSLSFNTANAWKGTFDLLLSIDHKVVDTWT